MNNTYDDSSFLISSDLGESFSSSFSFIILKQKRKNKKKNIFILFFKYTFHVV